MTEAQNKSVKMFQTLVETFLFPRHITTLRKLRWSPSYWCAA